LPVLSAKEEKTEMSWTDDCETARLALTKEKRQEFLDYMFDGMKLGDAAKKADISFDAANGIMRHQINSHLFLKREAD
jgi:DNA-directed RNA polymerase specialized sigma24 family protein